MAGTNQFVPFGTNSGANVLAPATYAALPARQAGFSDGIADPAQCNTAWRQPSEIAAAIGAFIALQGFDALDNGDITALRNNFQSALGAYFGATYGNTVLVRYGLDVSTTPNTLTVPSLSPSLSALSNGLIFEIIPNTTSTGSSSITIAGATLPVQTLSGRATKANDILVGRPILGAYYNGAFVLLQPTRSEVGVWASTEPSILVLTSAGARFASAFTAGLPFTNFPGGSPGTTGLPIVYTVVQTLIITGASYIDASGVVGFRCTNSDGSDCRARLIASGGGLSTLRVSDFLGCRTVSYNQIPCTVGLVLQNLNPQQSVTLQLIVDRFETTGAVEVYDPRISARHDGNV